MIVHKTRNCNGVILEKETVADTTIFWDIGVDGVKEHVVFKQDKDINVLKYHCLKCNEQWGSFSSMESSIHDFSLVAEKNLKIILTTIVLAMLVLFYSVLFVETLHILKSICLAVVCLVSLIIYFSKDICKMTELLNAVDDTWYKYAKKKEEK